MVEKSHKKQAFKKLMFDRLRRSAGASSMHGNGGYVAGSKSRATMTNWNPFASDANSDVSMDFDSIRSRSRDLVRNSPIANAIINTYVDSTIGTGLSMQCNPDIKFLGWSEDQAAEFKENVEREWKLWCENELCDASRIHNFYGLQRLAFQSMLESGDVLALTPSVKKVGSPYSLSVQLIESDRLSNEKRRQDTKNKISGVTIDGNGAAIAYDICKSHPGTLSSLALEWVTVPAYGENGRKNVIHLFDRKRPNQIRGLPLLTAVMETIKQLGRYSDAELQAAVVSAVLALIVKMDAEAFSTIFDDKDDSQAYMDSTNSLSAGIDVENPGKAIRLLPGESIEAPNFGRPNSNFELFHTALTSIIGVGVGIPKEVLMKSYNSSYTASRASLLDFYRTVRVKRDFTATNFCDPIKNLWFEEAAAIGRIKVPGFFADPRYRLAYSRVSWVGDSPGSINPKDEVAAAIARMGAGITNLKKESIAYDGSDWEETHIQLARENEMRKESGLIKDGMESA